MALTPWRDFCYRITGPRRPARLVHPRVERQSDGDDAAESKGRIGSRGLHRGFKNSFSALAIFVPALAVLATLFTPLPWLPPERIEMSSGEVATAFVLASSESELVVLRNEDRTVTRISRETVDSRGVCRLAGDADG